MELEERFWAKVQRGGERECWPWLKGHFGNGYGAFYLHRGDLSVDKGTQVGAHRLAFRLVHGHWPEPQALHGCDHPWCCNPMLPELELHIHEGSQSVNLKEAMARGRHPWAAHHPLRVPKLTIEGAMEVRRLYMTGIPQDALAARFNVGQSTISRIVRGRVSY